MKSTKLIEFITEISENGISFSHRKGFEFFRDILLPNIKNAEKITIDKLKLWVFWKNIKVGSKRL